MRWNENQEAQIIELYSQMPYIQIGKVLGKSRNAIAGIVWRLRQEGKLPAKRIKFSHPVPRPRKRIERIRNPKMTKAALDTPIQEPIIDPNRITIVNVAPQGCRYPLHKHERGIHMELCGKPARNSWCVEHRALVFQPRQPRKIRERQRV